MSNRSNRTDHPKADPELLTRTSWINAELAYRQVKRGRATGNTCALWLRLHLQNYLFSIGCLVQLHCGKVTFLGLLLLSLCCVGLKTGHLETNLEELWVEEGGRLEKELKYVKDTIGVGSGTSYELIIQSPKKGVSLLNMESVMFHYQAVLAATKIKVDIDGLTWSFKDICYTPEFPITENDFVDHILESILPCVIITPIDCFWEGSILLGPDPPVHTGNIFGIPSSLTWENLDPESILQKLEASSVNIPLNAMRDTFQRAGVTTAYQEKPCLNPKDPYCPKTASNYNSSLPDLTAEFTKGCSGFATKYMQWEHDLIFGGVKRNKTGHIVRVEAFQSILQLMAEKDLYHFYEDDQKVSGIDWTQQKARAVLEAFQRKFSKIMNNFGNETNKDNLYGFSTTSLMDMMNDLSNISVTRVVLGYVLMFIYACVSLLRWNDAVNSQSGIGMAGVILVSLSVAAGLGICSVLKINFNASTTQIIPFLTLGLGVDDMFLIAHTYFEIVDHVPRHELTGEVLKRSGVTVFLTSFSNMLAFFTAAIIPIPALRAFTLQAGILVLFNLGSVLLVYPAIVSLDLVRREDKRIDVFCCFQSSAGSNDVIELRPQPDDPETGQHRELTNLQREPSPPPPYTACGGTPQPPCYDTVTRSEPSGTVTTLAPTDGIFTRRLESPLGSSCPSTTSSRQCLTPDNAMSCKDRCVKAQKECLTWTLTCLASKVYAPFLQRTFVKVTVLVAFLIFLILGAWGTAQVKDGLDLTDIVPRDTAEFQFLEVQSKYFGFYSINMITQGDFDYANNQPLLYEYHNAFMKVKKISKKDNTLKPFWLELFRQWLLDLQVAFDKDKDKKLISNESWLKNASEEAILAYKLLIQTGDVNNPTNTNLATKNRLVDEYGIINPAAFYNYLSAWTTNDVMSYTYSMANFHPLPKSWQHDPTDNNLEVLKSQLLDYTQLPFFLTNLSSTEEVIEVITEIRKICDEFSKKGLPNFPSGVPFTFYEQYINLRFYLMLSLICVLVVTFLVLTIVLMNPWIAAIVVIVLGMMIVELFGFMGVAGIKLSAVPAVILIVSVGIGVEFTLHLSVGFITAIGSRNRRMAMALEHTFTPVVHGAISTFLGILMLVGTEFDFIVKYFFNALSALVFIGLFNGLMLLPVLLSIFGPQGEVIPKDNADCLASPTPEPSPKASHRYSVHSRRGSRRVYPRAHSDISLSTISEEPTQYSSHEIIVQPEVVVETTTLPGTCHDASHHSHQTPYRQNTGHGSGQNSYVTTNAPVHSNRYNLSPPDTPPPPPPSHITRVKATATVKVEVHTPIPGCVNQEHTYKSKRRKPRDCADNVSSGSSDSEPSWHIKHGSINDSPPVCERHHCNNPGSCGNQLQLAPPQNKHRRSSRGSEWTKQSGKSSSERQNRPSRSNRDDDNTETDSNV